MNINIEQLDNDERDKIKALVRERNDKDRDKGVDYIFRQKEDKELYLLGKKLDFSQMVNNDKALMGESEVEFKERMEHRKVLEKMREDPILIIHFNETQARKIAMEKKLVHDRFNEKTKVRHRNMSSSDSDCSGIDIIEKFKAILKTDTVEEVQGKSTNNDQKHRQDDISIKHSNSHCKSRKLSRSRLRRRYRNESISKDRYNKRHSKSNRNSSEFSNQEREYKPNRRRSISRERKLISKDKRKRSRSCDKRRVSRSPLPRKRTRSPNAVSTKYGKNNYPKIQVRSKLSDEEKKRRLAEMEQNAKDHQLRCSKLDKKFREENEREAKEMEKQMKNHDIVVLNNTIKMGQNLSLKSCLEENRKHNRIKTVFKK